MYCVYCYSLFIIITRIRCIVIVTVTIIIIMFIYGRFPKFNRAFLGRDPGTLKSDIVFKKKHPQSICSDLRLSNWEFEDWNYGNRAYHYIIRLGRRVAESRYISLQSTKKHTYIHIYIYMSNIYIYIYIYIMYMCKSWAPCSRGSPSPGGRRWPRRAGRDIIW